MGNSLQCLLPHTQTQRKCTHRHTTQLTPQPTAKEDKRSHQDKICQVFRFGFYRIQYYGARGRCIMGFIFPRLGFTYIYDLRHCSNKASYRFIYLFFLLSTCTRVSESRIAIARYMLTLRSIYNMNGKYASTMYNRTTICTYVYVCVWYYRFIENVRRDHLESSGARDKSSLFKMTRFQYQHIIQLLQHSPV